MSRIQVLSFEVANLIAAGEVVDRPASAIKEMMENAIDAGAKHITVEIQNGGVTLMRVTDDGCGMSEEDLPMAIRRHATSKITQASDLDGIATLGFRGEALAAISSVSDMRILSRQPDQPMGAILESSQGRILGVTPRGCAVGTTVVAENLFANVPARRKFLKRDATETMAVTANVERVALSHPDIAVRLICDGNPRLQTAGDGQLKSALYAVFGRDFTARLLEVKGVHEGVCVHGYIGRPDHVKANRNNQIFFINGRFVKSKTAMAALEQAYVSYIQPEKYPCGVLFLELNPSRVDVNVHPAKLEVKFSNEKPVFEAIYYTVRQTLEQNTVRPELNLNPSQRAARVATGYGPTTRLSDATQPVDQPPPPPLTQRQMHLSDLTHPWSSHSKAPPQQHLCAKEFLNHQGGAGGAGSGDDFPRSVSTQPAGRTISMPAVRPAVPNEAAISESALNVESEGALPRTEETSSPLESSPEMVTVPSSNDAPYRLVGEVFHSYLIVEQGERMLLIDKHAAHERLLFEELKARMQQQEVSTQLLMVPVDVMLMSDEVGLLCAYRESLEAIGFSLSFQKNTVQVKGVPAGIPLSAVSEMIECFAAQLKEGTGQVRLTRDQSFERALYQAACKAAIKAGRVYPDDQMKALIDRLMALPDITYCPHGRPVAMEVKKHTLDHRFERC